MREINKTIYEVLKMDEPEEGVNVTQLLTDDLIKKQESGEAKAVTGASQVLDKKAEELHSQSQGTKSNISINVSKATGNNTKAPKTPEIPGAAKKVSSKPATPKKATTGAVKKKAKVAKKPAPKPEKSSSPMGLILLIILLGAGAAYYFLMMK